MNLSFCAVLYSAFTLYGIRVLIFHQQYGVILWYLKAEFGGKDKEYN